MASGLLKELTGFAGLTGLSVAGLNTLLPGS
jgi:hypothetical protein